jgi:hypothetical protein
MMSDENLSFYMVLLLLCASYYPVNRCIGKSIETLLLVYFISVVFRGLCILMSFFNGARQELVFGIIIAVILEVSTLVRMSIIEENNEVLT